MASAAITIAQHPAIIESDTTEAVITQHSDLPGMEGDVVNLGAATVYCKISVDALTAANNVSTGGEQRQFQVALLSGNTLPWLYHYRSMAHKTAAGAATLQWLPSHRARRHA